MVSLIFIISDSLILSLSTNNLQVLHKLNFHQTKSDGKFFCFITRRQFCLLFLSFGTLLIFQLCLPLLSMARPSLVDHTQCPRVSHETTYMQYMQDIYFRIPLTQGSPKLCSVKSWDVTTHFIKIKKTDFEVHFY